jgi:hypothetical protein
MTVYLRLIDLPADRLYDLGFSPACVYSNYLIYNEVTFTART